MIIKEKYNCTITVTIKRNFDSELLSIKYIFGKDKVRKASENILILDLGREEIIVLHKELRKLYKVTNNFKTHIKYHWVG